MFLLMRIEQSVLVRRLDEGPSLCWGRNFTLVVAMTLRLCPEVGFDVERSLEKRTVECIHQFRKGLAFALSKRHELISAPPASKRIMIVEVEVSLRDGRTWRIGRICYPYSLESLVEI